MSSIGEPRLHCIANRISTATVRSNRYRSTMIVVALGTLVLNAAQADSTFLVVADSTEPTNGSSEISMPETGYAVGNDGEILELDLEAMTVVPTEEEPEEEETTNDRCCYGVCRAPGRPRKPHFQRPGDINESQCPPLRYRRDDWHRAGQPLAVAPWARPSVNHRYAGWYVGGGAAVGGQGRSLEEGTWGLDYRGLFRPRAVFMAWTCGREQGGIGAYATDTEPRVVSRAKETVEAIREAHPHRRGE